MKKILSPKEVLLAVITHYANTEDCHPDASASAKFIDDDGSVELTITEPTPRKTANDTTLN